MKKILLFILCLHLLNLKIMSKDYLDEVVVTATRSKEKLYNTSQSVEVINNAIAKN